MEHVFPKPHFFSLLNENFTFFANVSIKETQFMISDNNNKTLLRVIFSILIISNKT